jgi:hypothetical protein
MNAKLNVIWDGYTVRIFPDIGAKYVIAVTCAPWSPEEGDFVLSISYTGAHLLEDVDNLVQI